MNKKMNNKGFSLVELIVVIAIMGILAVTLAPRLSAYVEKARLGSDKEVVNSIYTAVSLAVLEDNAATSIAALTDVDTGFQLGDSDTATNPAMYTVNDNTWRFFTTYTLNTNPIISNIRQVVGEFNLKSSKATDASRISITINPDADGIGYLVSVTLDYDGSATTVSGNEYTADGSTVRQ